jgi:hypothetical protein
MWLSVVAALCAAVAAAVTLAWSGAFPEPSPAPELNEMLAEARGWSAATLVLALPLFIATLAGARAGSSRAKVAWLGTLAYLVYTELELAVSPPFTPLYLLYVVSFACAVTALVTAAATVDVVALKRELGRRAPRRTVAAAAIALGTILSLAWLEDIISRSAAGKFGWRDPYGTVAHVVQALDLGLQVPLAFAAAVMLLRRKPSADLLAGIWLVQAVCMGGALAAMVAFRAMLAGRGLPGALPFAALWLGFGALALAFYRPGSRT